MMERSGQREVAERAAGVAEIGWSVEQLFLLLTLHSHALRTAARGSQNQMVAPARLAYG